MRDARIIWNANQRQLLPDRRRLVLLARSLGEVQKRMDAQRRDRGLLQVDANECKGCGLCIEACPPKVIALSEKLNHYGYRTAVYTGSGCTACGICFLACPEPGAITVLRARNRGVKAVEVREAVPCASN